MIDPLELLIICRDRLGKDSTVIIQLEVVPNFQYLIYLALQLLTPISILAGLIKKRAFLQVYFCKKKYQYLRVETASVGQLYQKQIPLIKNDLKDSKPLFSILMKMLKK